MTQRMISLIMGRGTMLCRLARTVAVTFGLLMPLASSAAVWTYDSTEFCSDICGAYYCSACGYFLPCPSDNPEGMECNPASDTFCYVVHLTDVQAYLCQ